MDWIELITEEDVELLMEHVDGFHDWYVAGFSYDPLAQSEDDDLSLARFKVDADALTITFRWDAKTKRGTWPEVQVEFRCLHVFNFSNYNDPDPLWGCVIEKTSGGCWVFADDNCDGLSEEERLHPERIVSNLLVTCDEIRWRAV